LGNIVKPTLESVWQNEAYTQYRRNYLEGKVSGTLCEWCKAQQEGDCKFKPYWSILGFLAGQPCRYQSIPPPSSLEILQKPSPLTAD
jgi:hypothetical protein